MDIKMLQDVLFLFLWVTFPVVWHYMLKAAGLSLLRLSIPSFTIAAFYVYQYIGLPLLYLRLYEYPAVAGMDHEWLMWQVAFYTALTITMMLVSFVIARHHFGRLTWTMSYPFRPHNFASGVQRQTFGLVVLVTVCTAVLLLYFSQIGFRRIAFFVSLGFGDEILVAAARDAMGSAFKGRFHYYSLFIHSFLTFATLALFAQHLVRPAFTSRVVFLMAFVVAAIALMSETLKNPFGNLLIALFVVYALVKRSGRVPIRDLIRLLILVAAIMSLLFFQFMGSANLLTGLRSTISRVFTGQLAPAYYYLEYFQNHHEFLLGRSFPNPGGIFPFEHYPLSEEIMKWAMPETEVLGLEAASMPAPYWAEMYANFGFLGVLISSIFVGYGLYWLNAIVFRLQMTPLSIALMSWLLIHLKALAETFLSTYMFDIYIVGVLLVFGALSFFVGHGVIRFRSRKAGSPKADLSKGNLMLR